jgi:peptidoglycan-associated lipoprotein
MKRFLALAVILSLAPLLACGGKKRPPNVSTQGGAARSPEAGAPLGGSEPLPEGPDVQAVDRELASSADLLSDASGEGGPLEDIRFDYDSAELTPDARAVLERHAQWIKSHPGLRVAVEGHCDERGTVEYNLALGDQRARAARDYLVSLGVDTTLLTTVSYGKERPLDASGGEAAWARNRRAHFAVARR